MLCVAGQASDAQHVRLSVRHIRELYVIAKNIFELYSRPDSPSF